MSSMPRVARQLRSLMFWTPSVDEEVDEELAFHVAMRAREYVERGMDPDEARAAAIRKIR
ncbi:MAG: permease prefix domain 1-containing protein [Gemmatimonadota bacterium]|nr:permease prefix domain 1-containing protein [Gemmatimonadota bacterium]